MANTNKTIIAALVLVCTVLAVMVSASVGEEILKVPLFEIGGLWVQAIKDFFGSIKSLLLMPDLTSPWTYVGFLVSAVVVYYLYILLFAPLNRVRLLSDLGYIPEGKFSMKDIANEVRKRRAVGEIPPVYPNGWFAALESRDLPNPGNKKSINILGKFFKFFYIHMI